MKTTSTFSRTPLAQGVSLALLSCLGSSVAVPVLAQEAAPEERRIEEVFVTASYRASLIDSISSKRDSSSVIEANLR